MNPQSLWFRAFALIFKIAAPVIFIWWIYLQTQPAHDTLSNYLFNFFGYGVLWAAAGAVGIWRAREWGGWGSVTGRAVTLIGLGSILGGVGQFIWTYYNIFLTVEVPSPSLADIAWYASYIPFGWGLILLIRKIPVKADPFRIILSILFCVGMVTLFIGLGWQSIRGAEGLPAALTNAGYVIGDAFMTAISLIALSIWGGRLGKFVLFLALGNFLSAVADTVYLYRVNQEVYWNGDFGDLLFAGSAYLTAWPLIFLYPKTEETKE